MSTFEQVRSTDEFMPPDPEFGRMPPPHDISAEQCVLGGMLLSEDVIADVTGVLKGTDFYHSRHSLVFDAVRDLFARGEPADAVTVAAELTRRGELPRAGGMHYLFTLIQVVPVAANAMYYAKIVHDKAVWRRLIQAGTRVVQFGYSEKGDVTDVVSRAQAVVFDVASGGSSQSLSLVGSSLGDTLNEIEERQAGGTTSIGVPTGLRDLDNLIHGLYPGQLVVVAARPGLGKSTLALDFCRSASVRHGLASVIFSLEMSRNEIVMRLLASEARVPLHCMRGGQMRDEDWVRLAGRLNEVAQAPLYIDDSSSLALPEIRAKARQLKQRDGLRLVVVDYLQLMSGVERVESRQQEVAAMSRSLKLLAKELEVPVVAVSQLNRGSEQRQDRKPRLTDLRESGAIEQDADVVILLHREDVYESETPRAGEADLIVAKHRNGPVATVTAVFQGHYSRFVDLAI